ncbi:hypothetical protein HYX13_04675 [Candidatus Woesearchaeota archaeon]|nr:hypothetical protein [Candidatus Woesearchaeota archaeon]
MKEAVKKEILYDLQQAQKILERKDPGDMLELKELSNHAIEDVAAQKDIDLIAVSVLLYSLYKISEGLQEKEYGIFSRELQMASSALQRNFFAKYNASIKRLYSLVRESNAPVREHLQDVLQAARIKKGSVLLQKGLSIGQAAGLMGLSNWDLQAYAGKTTALEQHTENISAKKRVLLAFNLFGVKS